MPYFTSPLFLNEKLGGIGELGNSWLRESRELVLDRRFLLNRGAGTVPTEENFDENDEHCHNDNPTSKWEKTEAGLHRIE